MQESLTPRYLGRNRASIYLFIVEKSQHPSSRALSTEKVGGDDQKSGGGTASKLIILTIGQC